VFVAEHEPKQRLLSRRRVLTRSSRPSSTHSRLCHNLSLIQVSLSFYAHPPTPSVWYSHLASSSDCLGFSKRSGLLAAPFSFDQDAKSNPRRGHGTSEISGPLRAPPATPAH